MCFVQKPKRQEEAVHRGDGPYIQYRYTQQLTYITVATTDLHQLTNNSNVQNTKQLTCIMQDQQRSYRKLHSRELHTELPRHNNTIHKV